MLEIILAIITVLLIGIFIILPSNPIGTYTFERDDLDTDPPSHR